MENPETLARKIFLQLFQLRVRVQDGGDPKKFDTEVLTVRVTRNLRKPIMVAGNYQKRILEIQAIGVELLRLNANDNDNFVSILI